MSERSGQLELVSNDDFRQHLAVNFRQARLSGLFSVSLLSALACWQPLILTSGLPVTRQETRHRAIGEVPSIASCDYGEFSNLITRTGD
jgi:hypothetical protein